MKKNHSNLFIVILVLFIGLVSCGKQNNKDLIKETSNPDENVKSVLMSAADSSIELYTYLDLRQYSDSFQRYIFQHMSPESKARIWTEKIQYMVTEEFQDQPDAINQLTAALQLISPEIYENGPTEEQAQEADNWVANLVTIVGFDMAKQICTTMSGQVKIEMPDGPEYHPNIIKCNCASASDWCHNSTYCKFGQSDCAQSANGCGTFWWYDCDGRCAVGPQ